jgi:hypothetical protein
MPTRTIAPLVGRFVAVASQPPLSRPEVARRVAADIMNCWTGA